MILALLHLHTPLDPLHNDGYQWWSGLGSGSPLFVGLLLWWHKHNCHRRRCLRLSWHPDGTGHPVCKRHHPDHPSGKPNTPPPVRRREMVEWPPRRHSAIVEEHRGGKTPD